MLMRDSNLLPLHDRKLALSFGAVVLILMITATGAASYLFAQLNKKQEDRLSRAIAVILEESISRVSFSGKYHARLFVEEMKSRVPELAFISVETRDGLVIAHSDPAKNDESMMDPVEVALRIQSLKTLAPASGEHIYNGKTIKEVVLPYRGGPDAGVIGVVRAGINFDEVRKEQRSNRFMLLVLVAVLTAAAIWGILILSHLFGGTIRGLATQLQGILNYAPVAIGISDRTGRILAYSVEFEHLFGRPLVEQTQMQLFAELLSNSNVKSLAETDQNVFESGVPSDQELEVDIRGILCTWHVSKFPIARDDEGKTTLICAFIHDITERKRMERSLVENEARLRTLVQTIPDLIWLKDADGIYLFCNPKFESLYGAKETYIVGKTDYDFVDRRLADFFRENDRKAIEAGKPSANEEWLTFAEDGYQGLFETIKTPMYDAEGNFIGVLGISHDITERKRAEEERIKLEERLQQSYKMEAIGSLAGGIAHDFNNILSSVLGFAELARMKLEKKEYIEHELDGILKAGIRARDLVKQILTFSRQTGIKREPLELAPLINETLKLLRASLPVTIDIRQEFPISDSTIIADPIQIHQVIMNICTNAAYAMKEKGGVLTIRLAEVELDDEVDLDLKGLKRGRYIQLTIADTGSGISKENIKKIFDPFFTTKQRGEGTGMGLSVVHGIVKDMGGAISAYSEPGKGSTFHVLFPKYGGISPVADSSNITTRSGSGRILFVDDEEGVIASGRGILEQLGYKITSTTSPTEALELFTSDPDAFDLVLTDLTMPKITGLELSERLQKIRPHIPIVLCTGFSMGISPERIRESGISEMVMKPMVASELSEAVYRALNPGSG